MLLLEGKKGEKRRSVAVGTFVLNVGNAALIELF